MNLDLDTLRALAVLLTENDITEFEHEADGVRTKIVRGARAATPVFTTSYPPYPPPYPPGGGGAAPGAWPGSAPGAEGATARGAASDEAPSDAVDVTSPFVGTFYRSPSPDAPSFVEVGSIVRPGQTICIVEAMKLMNEIEAECSGTIIEVFAQNGKAVEFGQKLYRIKKA